MHFGLLVVTDPGVGVSGLGFRLLGSGSGVWGFGFRVEGGKFPEGSRVQGVGVRTADPSVDGIADDVCFQAAGQEETFEEPCL